MKTTILWLPEWFIYYKDVPGHSQGEDLEVAAKCRVCEIHMFVCCHCERRQCFFFHTFCLKISYKYILAEWESHWRLFKKKKKVSLINTVPRFLSLAIQNKWLEGVQMTTHWNMERHWKVLPRQVACICFSFQSSAPMSIAWVRCLFHYLRISINRLNWLMQHANYIQVLK